MEFKKGGNLWGVHRVIEPRGGLPQSAFKLEASLPPFENELVVNIRRLQIDSASFRQMTQMEGEHNKIPLTPFSKGGTVEQQIRNIVAERGKMHNPATNSGGVFLGKLDFVGPLHPLRGQLHEGDEVISLVSLTLTPLSINKVGPINGVKETVDVEGHAVVFESGMVKRMPEDFSEGVALAAMDICGAPAQVKRLIHPRDKVLVVGLGKAGRSAVVQASQMGASVFGLDESEEAVVWCQKNVEGHFNRISASHVQDVHGWAAEETGKKLMDVTVSATSAPNTEMAAILPCREGGKALFFGMQTSFQKVVLGAEGVGKDIQLLMGSGFVPGHADLMFNLLRNHKPLRRWFEEKFG